MRFQIQPIHATVAIEGSHACEAGINHGSYAIDGERCLRDVGGENDLAQNSRSPRGARVPPVVPPAKDCHAAVQGHAVCQPFPFNGSPRPVRSRLAPGRNAKISPGWLSRFFNHTAHMLFQRADHAPAAVGPVLQINRINASGHFDHRAIAQKFRHRLRLQRRGHDDNFSGLAGSSAAPSRRNASGQITVQVARSWGIHPAPRTRSPPVPHPPAASASKSPRSESESLFHFRSVFQSRT